MNYTDANYKINYELGDSSLGTGHYLVSYRVEFSPYEGVLMTLEDKYYVNKTYYTHETSIERIIDLFWKTWKRWTPPEYKN